MKVERDVEPNELPDEVIPEADDALIPFEYSCEVCGVELHYAGKGRKPKRCTEHKLSGVKNPASVGARKGTAVSRLVEQIEQTYASLGMALSFVPATSSDGPIVAMAASNLAESWRPIIERDPKMRAMWEKFFSVSGYGGLIVAHAMVIVPIVQNHGLMGGARNGS